MTLFATLFALFGSTVAQEGPGNDYGFVWLIVGVLAVIALLIYIIGRARR